MSQKGQCTWTREKALAYGRDWYRRNRDQQLARAKERHKKNPAARRASWVRSRLKKYGLSVEQYESMVQLQGNLCAICGRSGEQSSHGVLAVDHDHGTGAPRDLLCSYCNQMIGLAFECPETLKRAIAYLRKHSK